MNDQLGWFRRTFLRQKGVSLSSPEALRLLGAPISASGMRVSAESALSVPAVRAATQLISGTIAALDVRFIRKGPGGQRTELSPAEYPPAAVLRQPNPWTTGTEFRRNLVADFLLHGTGYAHVVRLRGQPAELHRLDPRAVTAQVDVDSYEPVYRATINGQSLALTWRDVLVLRNLTLDGLRGRGVVDDAAEAIGTALVIERFVAQLFSGGARPGGVLRSDKKLSADAAKRLAEAWRAVTGKDNTGSVAILEDGLQWQSLGLNAVDAETSALRTFQIGEVSRAFNVSPVLLGDLSKASLSNVEQAQRMLLASTLTPILELLEDEIERLLVAREDRDVISAEFDVSGFIRSDPEKQAALLRAEVELGVSSVNEARAARGRSPVPGGDRPMTTIQSRPLDAPAATSPKGSRT